MVTELARNQTTGYVRDEWTPNSWHVFLCDLNGKPIEELVDVDFDATDTLNEIPTCTVSVAGRKPGYFRPWEQCIALTRDTMQQVFFFGPIVSTRTKLVTSPGYSTTTELTCQGWEAWLERVFPAVTHFSYGDKTAWEAVLATWTGGDTAGGINARELKFQKRSACVGQPEDGLKWPVPAWLEWEYTNDDAGNPSAWALHQELHTQGIDVGLRATWDAAAGSFRSRYVIGGSSNSTAEDCRNPKTGRVLDTELVVGADVADLTFEQRGDLQANAVVATGGTDLIGVAPMYDGVRWFDPIVPNDSFAGMLLELQVNSENARTVEATDPDAILRELAARHRLRFKNAPVFVSELKVRYAPGSIRPGDVITISDNGGAQIVDPLAGSTVYSRWALTARVASVSVSSDDALFADLTVFETQGDGELQDIRLAGIDSAALANWYETLSGVSGWVARLAALRR